MPQDSPQPVLTEQQWPGRPIPNMTANVNEFVDRLRAKLVGWDALGEITIDVDLFGVARVLVLHIPLPK